jgi:hypothetical protein
MGTAQRSRNGCIRRPVRAAAITAAACGALGVAARDARATTAYAWESAVSGLWSDATKWTPDTGTPTLIDDTAALVATGAAHTVTLDADQSIGALTLDSLDATLALNGKTLTLTGGTSVLNAGAINIDAVAGLVQSGGTFQVVGGAVTGPGRVHLRDLATLRLDGGGAGTFMFSDTGTLSGAVAGNPFALSPAMNLVVRGDVTSGTGATVVSATGTLTAFGNITLDSAGGSATPATLAVSGALNNHGTLSSNVGSGGTRRINAGSTFTNYGSINVNTDTTIQTPTLNNYGAVTIAPGTTLALTGTSSFLHNAGTLSVPAGTPFNMNGGTFGLLGGTVSGQVNMNSFATLTVNGAGGGGNFVFADSGQLNTSSTQFGSLFTIPATTTVTVRGDTVGFPGSSLAASGATLTNNGILTLDSIGVAAGSTFTYSGVSFTNNGVINSNVGSGGSRRIATSATFTNNGSININADTTLEANVHNYGTFTIAPGRTISLGSPIGGGRSFHQLAGNLTIAPDVPLTINSGTFSLLGGTVSGTVNLMNSCVLALGPGSGPSGSIPGAASGGTYVVQDFTTLTPTSTSVTVPESVTIAVRGDQTASSVSSLTVSGTTFTNNGAILLDSVGASTSTTTGSASFTHLGSTFVNNGTVSSNVGAGGTRRIAASLLTNNGSFNINTVTTLETNFTNFGTFAIAPGTTALFGFGRNITQAAGLMSIPDDTPLNLSGSNTFSLTGGVVSGTILFGGSASFLMGNGSGGTYVVQDTMFLTNTTGSSPMTVPAGSTFVVRGDNVGSATASTLTVSPFTFTNNGSITLDSLGAAAGSTLNVSTGTFTNNGVVTSNPGSGGTRSIMGSTLTNNGTLAINTDTSLELSVVNYGTFAIAPGTNAKMGISRSVVQNAGSLTIAPDVPLTMSGGGSFVLAGGTVSGTVNLTGSASLHLNGGSGGNFVFLDSTQLMTTAPSPQIVVPASTTVTVRADSPGASTTVNVMTNTINLGTVSLDSTGGALASTLNVTAPTFTNYGALNSNVGSGGARTVNANALNNFGTINVNAETNFNADVVNHGTINLNEAATFRSLTGNGALAGAGEKIFAGGASSLATIKTGNGGTTVESTASLTVGNIKDGTVTVDGLLTIAPSGEASGGAASKVDTLVIGATGKVDLSDNKLVIAGPTASLAAVEAAIAAGSNGGAWDGASGIVTGMPDALTGLTSLGAATATQIGKAGGTFGGVSVAGDDVLVMYTYAGDSNLDGFISGDDYSNIDFNIATPGATGWYNGDFNHDGIISGDDYTVIDFNIVAQGAPFSTSGAAAGAGLNGVTAVPEPASLTLLSLSALAAGRRRRRYPSI